MMDLYVTVHSSDMLNNISFSNSNSKVRLKTEDVDKSKKYVQNDIWAFSDL